MKSQQTLCPLLMVFFLGVENDLADLEGAISTTVSRLKMCNSRDLDQGKTIDKQKNDS